MRNKGTARPVARKGSTRTEKTKKTAAVPSRKSEPIIQMVERRSSPRISPVELPKKVGELPIPTSTFVF
jgi:hypothetical protein